MCCQDIVQYCWDDWYQPGSNQDLGFTLAGFERNFKPNCNDKTLNPLLLMSTYLTE